MSLATRCTACGTVFRVVQDQLKVSSGWVRCGRCGEVFNAIESLVDVAPERPESTPPASVHGPRVMAELARMAPPGQPGHPINASVDEAEATAQADSIPVDAVLDASESTASVVRVEATVSRVSSEPTPADEGQAVEALPGEPATEAAIVPGFVHRAAQEARWRHPAVRGGLALVMLLAALTLGLQVATSHHDWIAARWPVLRTAVVQLCRLSNCQVQAPLHLAALSVESSSLQRQRQGQHFVLTVSLRNRSSLAVRMPAMDLVLSDASGRPAVRRVMTPLDFGVAGQHINAGASESLTARLQVQGQPILGYTVELFYP